MTQYVEIHVRFSKIQTRVVKARLLSKDELLVFSELGEILIWSQLAKKIIFFASLRLAETTFFKSTNP